MAHCFYGANYLTAGDAMRIRPVPFNPELTECVFTGWAVAYMSAERLEVLAGLPTISIRAERSKFYLRIPRRLESLASLVSQHVTEELTYVEGMVRRYKEPNNAAT